MASNDEVQLFITCELCGLRFASVKTLEQHVREKNHQRQIDYPKKEIQLQPVDGDSCLEETKDSNPRVYICNQCETVFSGIIPFTQHQKSKHHAKVLRRQKDDIGLFEDKRSDSELSDNDNVDLKEFLKRISPKPYGTCSICEKQFNGHKSYIRHIKSKSHAKRKCELALLKKIKVIFSTCEDSETEEICEETGKEKFSPYVEAPEKLKCKDCSKDFSTAFTFARHLVSKTHEKRLSQNKLVNDLKVIKMLKLEDDSSSSDGEESSDALTCETCSMVFSGPGTMKAHILSKKHQKSLKLMKLLSKKAPSVEDGSRSQSSLEGEDGHRETDDTEKHKKKTGYRSIEDGSSSHARIEEKVESEKEYTSLKSQSTYETVEKTET